MSGFLFQLIIQILINHFAQLLFVYGQEGLLDYMDLL